jgi:hypothetical protein
MDDHVVAALRLLKDHLRVLIGKDNHVGTRIDCDELALIPFEIRANRLHHWQSTFQRPTLRWCPGR